MRTLLLEDDVELNELLSSYLKPHMVIDTATTLNDAINLIEQYRYDIALLDRNINGQDLGMILIDRIRQKDPDTGIIVISAYDSIADKVIGLNMGADDYMDKPIDNDELLARIFALYRRNQPQTRMEIEGISFDLSKKNIFYEGKPVPLTRKESAILFYLLQKRGTIVAKEELLDALYDDPQNISSNTIDVTLGHIRKKLPVNIIKTVKTRGYLVE